MAPDGSIEERIARLEAMIEVELRELRNDVHELVREISGPTGDPMRKPLRRRVHDLEGTDRAERLVAEALDAFREAQQESGWTRFQRITIILTTVFAGLASVAAVTTVIVTATQ